MSKLENLKTSSIDELTRYVTIHLPYFRKCSKQQYLAILIEIQSILKDLVDLEDVTEAQFEELIRLAEITF